MRTFAEKPKVNQPKTSQKSLRSCIACFGKSNEVTPELNHHSHSGIQTLQRLSRSYAEEPQAECPSFGSHPFGHDFSRIPAFQPAPIPVQPKLTVSAPGDRYEQEADRIADEVMRMPETPFVLRKYSRCEDEDKQALQKKGITENGSVSAKSEVPSIVHKVLSSPGQPLDLTTRSLMELRFGRNLSQVRVHTDTQAAESASAVGAIAYTVGNQIAFNTGRYAPETSSGQRLLAHELAHTLQQGEIAGLRPALLTPRLQRVGLFESLARLFGGGTFSEHELLVYLDSIRLTNKIEDSNDSDNKARAIVARWKNGEEKFAILTVPMRILLIKEMLSGFVGDDDEQAILDLLRESIESERENILQVVGVDALRDAFHGEEYRQLLRLLSDQEDMLPLDSGSAWSVPSLQAIIERHGDAGYIKFVIDHVYKIVSFKRAFIKWSYPDGSIKEEQITTLRGSTNRKSRTIRINAALSTTEAASNFVHEVSHAMRPEANTDDEDIQQEVDVRVATEEFRIRHGLKPTKPAYRHTDGSVDRAAIEKHVKGNETYNPPEGKVKLGIRYEDEVPTKGWRLPDTPKKAKP